MAAYAQELPQLTITALSITTERTSAPEGQAFHLTIHVHAKQRNANLASLILPDVTNLTILGDEKHSSPVREGSDYTEVLTVAGIAPGEATVSPAYIDARDPSRGDRPFRFSSNALRLRITSLSSAPVRSTSSAAKSVLRAATATALGALALVLLGFVIARAAKAHQRRTYVTLPPARPVTQRPQAPPTDLLRSVRDASMRLAGERTRTNAAALRAALFAYAGARADETLASLLARIPAERTSLRSALRAAERATFVDEPNLQGAIADLLDAARHVSTA